MSPIYATTRRLLRSAIRVAFAVAFVAVLSAAVEACPTCKESLAENDPQGQSLAAGFYYSILLMMGMPFLILGTFATLAYRTVQRAKIHQELPEREVAIPRREGRGEGRQPVPSA